MRGCRMHLSFKWMNRSIIGGQQNLVETAVFVIAVSDYWWSISKIFGPLLKRFDGLRTAGESKLGWKPSPVVLSLFPLSLILRVRRKENPDDWRKKMDEWTIPCDEEFAVLVSSSLLKILWFCDSQIDDVLGCHSKNNSPVAGGGQNCNSRTAPDPKPRLRTSQDTPCRGCFQRIASPIPYLSCTTQSQNLTKITRRFIMVKSFTGLGKVRVDSA